MHHDSAVSTAVRTITANVPDVRVVEYGSPEYALMIHRVLGRVVWVSHGSDEGILAGSQVLSWQAFSSRTEITPGKDIVLACHSAAMHHYVENVDNVMTFDGVVDAVLGSLLVSAVITQTPNIIQRFIEYGFSLMRGAYFLNPLSYVFAQLSYDEAGYWLALAMLVLGSALFSYYNPDMGFWTKTACIAAMAGISEVLITLAYLHLGKISPMTAATKIVGFILGTMIGAMVTALTGNLLALGIFYACVLATIASWGASAGAIAVAKVVSAFAGVLAFIAGLFTDIIDANTWVG